MKNFDYLKHFEKKHVSKISRFGLQNQPLQRGDSIKVGLLVKESVSSDSSKTRIQFFDGIILSIHGSHFEKRITLRQPRRPGSFSIERIFSLHSPQIQTLQILQSQRFCRSKLFFLRKSIGKAAFGMKKNS